MEGKLKPEIKGFLWGTGIGMIFMTIFVVLLAHALGGKDDYRDWISSILEIIFGSLVCGGVGTLAFWGWSKSRKYTLIVLVLILSVFISAIIVHFSTSVSDQPGTEIYEIENE